MTALIEKLGALHPALVHFPVALVLTAAVAEWLYATRKSQFFGDAARFMIAAAAWVSIPAAVAGFAASSGRTFPPELQGAFTLHRIVGITTPVLAILTAGLCEGTRRSGQVWEQALYRVFLALAVASTVAAGFYGGLLGHAAR
jgi:uncharacterized membrane protein